MSADAGRHLSLVPDRDAVESAGLSLALPPELLDALADRLAPRVAALLQQERQAERWLNSEQAAAHLGTTKNALHKLTSARQIPFEQDGPGCKLWFKESELDRWRRGGTER